MVEILFFGGVAGPNTHRHEKIPSAFSVNAPARQQVHLSFPDGHRAAPHAGPAPKAVTASIATLLRRISQLYPITAGTAT